MSSNYGSECLWREFLKAVGWRGMLGILVRWFDEPVRGFPAYYWVTALDVEREFEPGWFEFAWRPIRGSTFSNRFSRRYDGFGWKPRLINHPSHGYNYCNKGRFTEVMWLRWKFAFWAKWDFHMSERGPVDWDEPTKPRLRGRHDLIRLPAKSNHGEAPFAEGEPS